MRGAAVCNKHGGSAPQVRQAAAHRHATQRVEGEVAELLAECDLPDQHPIDGLLEVVRFSAAMARMFGAMAGELKLRPGDGEALYGPDHNGDARAHVLVQLAGEWSDRHARSCALALKANIDERLIRNAEETSEVMFDVLARAMVKADMPPEQRDKLFKALGEELRALSSGAHGGARDAHSL